MSVIFTEGFETDGNGTRYTTSVAEYTDGLGDFFTRTDGTNTGSFYEITSVRGSWYFAAMDTNGEPGTETTVTLQIDDIDITSFTNLGFTGLFAEDDDGFNQDWDADSLVYVEARIDNGAWVKILQFAGSGTNTEPRLDTDFDGIGDGAFLSDALTGFSAAIAGTGSELDLKVTIENLEAGDEDIAFDDLSITGTSAATEVDVLNETFVDASKFTTSFGFFSDEAVSSGFDFFGISDGAGGGDFGTGDPALTNVKSYTGNDGRFLTGMDLDGEGAPLPITATWTALDISGLTDLKFEGDFAEFIDGAGNIDIADFIKITASIDGGAAQTILEFRGDGSNGSFNGNFSQDTDFDGVGDGALLTADLSTFMANIAGTGATLDLTLEVRVNAGNEDFAVDNFRVIGASDAIGNPAVIAKSGDGLTVDENGTLIDSFTVELSTVPTGPVAITVSAPDGQSLVSLDGLSFSPSVIASPTDTTPIVIHVQAVDDAVDEATPHFGEITFTTASADPDYNDLAVTPLTVEIEDNDYTITKIHDIQGAGDASAMQGDEVTVEAVVTGLVTNGLGNVTGFFIQEEDADVDADATTSEGIYVFLPGASVSVGDKVRITATVAEFNDLTELASVTEISTLDSGVQLPTVTVINIDLNADYEAVEGMRVELVSGGDPLTVIENFNLDRFGEVVVSEGIQTQPTQIYDPQTEQAEIGALAEQNAANRLIIEDNILGQNPDTYVLIDSGDGTPLTVGDAITEEGPTLRLGSELASVTGIMNYGFGDYRLQVAAPLEVVEGTGERPIEVPDVGGDLQVASFNVLNFFTTLDQSGAGTGPNGDLAPRGADNQFEYDRQLAKLVEAIVALDAEVIGLQELENNGFGPDSAIAALVDALNLFLGDDVYSFVDPGTGFVGTDAIATGIIYKHDVVDLTGASVLVYEEPSADATFAVAEAIQSITGIPRVADFDRNRPTVAATFTDEDGSEFTVAVSHFKSKGASGLDRLLQDAINAGVDQALIDALLADPNYDQGDGQGFWNQIREDAAVEQAEWLGTNPTGASSTDNLVLLGDLNAYAQEDPVQALIDAGFTDLAQAFIGLDAYSFVFDGMQGTLDYGLASVGLIDNITGVAEWHIAADEPDLLNYDESFNNPAFYNVDPFAASDHDPMLIGLTLDDPTLTAQVDFGGSGKFMRAAVYSEGGEVLSSQNMPRHIKEFEIRGTGITITAKDDDAPGNEFVSSNPTGLGVYSQKTDKANEPSRIDEGETLTFALEDTNWFGDALEVEFEFNDIHGSGQIALQFYDDETLVETAIYDASGGAVQHDLALNTSFDTVELIVLGDTSLELASVAFARLMIGETSEIA